MNLTLRILRAMYRDTEYTIADLTEMVHSDAPAVERTLAALSDRGLVERRHGERYRRADVATW